MKHFDSFETKTSPKKETIDYLLAFSKSVSGLLTRSPKKVWIVCKN